MKNIRESFVDAARQWRINKVAGKGELQNEATSLLRTIKNLQKELAAVKAALETVTTVRAAVFTVMTGETNSEQLHRDIVALHAAYQELQRSFGVFLNSVNTNIKPTDTAFVELSSLTTWIGKLTTNGAEKAALDAWVLSAEAIKEVVKHQRELEAHMARHDRIDATGDFSATIAWRTGRDRLENAIRAEQANSERNAAPLSVILSPHPDMLAFGIRGISDALGQAAAALENLLMELWKEKLDEKVCANLINMCCHRIYENRNVL